MRLTTHEEFTFEDKSVAWIQKTSDHYYRVGP